MYYVSKVYNDPEIKKRKVVGIFLSNKHPKYKKCIGCNGIYFDLETNIYRIIVNGYVIENIIYNNILDAMSKESIFKEINSFTLRRFIDKINQNMK